MSDDIVNHGFRVMRIDDTIAVIHNGQGLERVESERECEQFSHLDRSCANGARSQATA